jgi:universal stress protein A
MIKIKSILCPVDFLPASDKALQYAAALAEDYGAKIHLLHVITPLIPVARNYTMGAVEIMKSVEDAVTIRMNQLVANLQTRGLEVTSKIFTGDVHLWIEETLATKEPDLIVVGSQARSGVKRLFIGSVAEWLMRNSPVPVLVISEKQKTSIQQPIRAA